MEEGGRMVMTAKLNNRKIMKLGCLKLITIKIISNIFLDNMCKMVQQSILSLENKYTLGSVA